MKFWANVNPLGLSEHVKEQLAGRLDILSSYPDRDYTSLRSTISEYCNIPAEFILPGNGSSELIALLIQERNPKHTHEKPFLLLTYNIPHFYINNLFKLKITT